MVRHCVIQFAVVRCPWEKIDDLTGEQVFIRFPVLMSNFVDIDFVIKLNDKKSRRFDLSEAIFKCEKNMKLA